MPVRGPVQSVGSAPATSEKTHNHVQTSRGDENAWIPGGAHKERKKIRAQEDEMRGGRIHFSATVKCHEKEPVKGSFLCWGKHSNAAFRIL